MIRQKKKTNRELQDEIRDCVWRLECLADELSDADEEVDNREAALQETLWKARTTGQPDLFGPELRSFWDNKPI